MYRVLPILACVLVLSGCGFHPLYQQETYEDLSQIKINVIKDRQGQILRNHLIDMIHPKGYPKTPKYWLNVKMKDVERKLLFRRDATSRYIEVEISVDFELHDSASGDVVYKDRLKRISSYAVGAQSEFGSFSTSVAQKNNLERALKVIAEDIRIRLSGFLARKSEGLDAS